MDLKPTYDLALTLARRFQEEGGRALIVGGFVRDEVLRMNGHSVSTKDVDLEVYGLAPESIGGILDSFGKVVTVGESFLVWKIGALDVSIPRRDSKAGPGHTGFHIDGDPNMSVAEATRRRDLTINALALDPITEEIIDHWGGREDVRRKLLRATDPVLFGDDPLRVLRMAQFAGRFGFAIEPRTMSVARKLPLDELAAERIGEEWKKLLLRAEKPSVGLEAMRAAGAIGKLHPELFALIDTPQDPKWHPEGDVWVHTGLVIDAAAEIVRCEGYDEDTALLIMFAALCHDLGKPDTTAFIDGRWRSRAHSEAGEAPTRSFLTTLAVSSDLTEGVVKLVREHLWPTLNFDREISILTAGDGAVRRLALRLHPVTIPALLAVAEADRRGRTNVDTSFPEGPALRERAAAIQVESERPRPLLLGRHLIAMGLSPGPEFAAILTPVFEAQLDGQVQTLDQAIAIARQIVEERSLL